MHWVLHLVLGQFECLSSQLIALKDWKDEPPTDQSTIIPLIRKDTISVHKAWLYNWESGIQEPKDIKTSLKKIINK